MANNKGDDDSVQPYMRFCKCSSSVCYRNSPLIGRDS